jgi:hypothetical protein
LLFVAAEQTKNFSVTFPLANVEFLQPHAKILARAFSDPLVRILFASAAHQKIY